MKTFVGFLFFLLLNLNAQSSPKELSLSEATIFALENNPEIINAKRDIDKAYKEKWKTIAIGLPQVKANFDYTNFLEMPVSLIPAQFFGGKEGDFAEVSFGTEQSLVGSARITQIIFDGSYLLGVKATKTYLEVSDNALQKTNIEVRKSVYIAYLNTLLSKENISILDKNIRNLEDTLDEAKKIFQNATALTGITPSFLNWAQEKVKRKSRENDCFFPLAYPMKKKKIDIAFWEKILVERMSSKIVCFFGNLGQQFDFQDIFRFSNQYNEYTFVICGSGDRLSEYQKKYASERMIFPGWVDHEKILGLMQLSKAAIAPYKNSFDFQMSIPNKIVEYIYGGVPIVTSLDGDVKNLIEKKSLGFHYKQGDLIELKNALEACSDNIESVKLEAKKVCKEFFDFDKTVKINLFFIFFSINNSLKKPLWS